MTQTEVNVQLLRQYDIDVLCELLMLAKAQLMEFSYQSWAQY